MLYIPKGAGQFPVLFYAHGSAPGSWSNEAFEAIAAQFTARGWAVFAPYRRGQGLSQAAGPYIVDEIAAARSEGGQDVAQARLAHLLATDHWNDQSMAFDWLLRQPFADRRRIAAIGNSFGGIIALLAAQKLPVCASIDAAGAADSWSEAPAVRELMTQAARQAKVPVLYFQAKNDFDVAPSRVLHATALEAGKEAELRLYPPFGDNAAEGRAFTYRGAAIWTEDVYAFLSRTCP